MKELSASTQRAYETDIRIFHEWCASKGVDQSSGAAQAVSEFIQDQAEGGHPFSTLSRRVAALRVFFSGLGTPLVIDGSNARSIIQAKRAAWPTQHRKVGLRSSQIRQMSDGCDDSMIGLRDRAIITTLFATAMRRSEIASMTTADIEWEDGSIIFARRDKGLRSREISIPNSASISPRLALLAWLKAAKIEAGPIFRPINRGGAVLPIAITDRSIANIIKSHASAAHVNSAAVSTSSLRRGRISEELANGRPIRSVAAVAGIKSGALMRYID
jgi:site-specific recombinase XerD